MTTPIQTERLKLDLIAWIAQLDQVDALERILELKKQLETSVDLPTKPKRTYLYQDVVAIANQYPPDKRWTYAELVRVFPANLKVKVEILNNTLFIEPSSVTYQIVSNDIACEITNFVTKKELGEVLRAPMDTKFDEDNLLQPDIMFIAVTRYDILEENYINGAPDIVVEIISPANKKQEREEKHALYERAGVKEYWTVFPKKRTIKVETLEEGKFQTYCEGKKTGEIRSKILEGFSIKIEDIMPESLFENTEKKKKKGE
ncbi:MAG: Uma2 family endonuclease [Bacteroidetes bacterium]|nr:MAG: Uma2 family endonuclease [Bacteroidota bacterium]